MPLCGYQTNTVLSVASVWVIFSFVCVCCLGVDEGDQQS